MATDPKDSQSTTRETVTLAIKTSRKNWRAVGAWAAAIIGVATSGAGGAIYANKAAPVALVTPDQVNVLVQASAERIRAHNREQMEVQRAQCQLDVQNAVNTFNFAMVRMENTAANLTREMATLHDELQQLRFRGR